MEESGVVDENDHVEIHERYLDSNKKSTRNTSRDEFLNDSIASYIDDEYDEFNRYKLGDNAFQRDYKNSQRKQNYMGRRKLNEANRASSECNIRVKNNTLPFPIGSGKKIANPNKKKDNNYHFRKLRDINGNLRTYKSSLELSAENPNKFHHRQFDNKLIYHGSSKQDKENISINYNNILYGGNNIIPFTYEQSYVDKAAIVRNQSAALSEFVDKSFSPYFDQGLSLDTEQFNNHGFHQMKPNHQQFVNDGNAQLKYCPTSLINNENNPLMMRQSNCTPFSPAFPHVNYDIYHENLISNDRFKNYHLENVSRDANIIQTNQSLDHDYSIRYDNNYEMSQNEFSVMNSLNDNQKIIINNGMVSHVPKFNTKSFGLGRTGFHPGLTIRNDNQNQLNKQPRPILSRNTIKNLV